MKKRSVCILFGGCSTEYEVSLVSAASVIRRINKETYDLTYCGVTRDGDFYLFDGDVDQIESGAWCSEENAHLRRAVTVDVSRSRAGFVTADGARYRPDVVFPVMHGANCEDGTLQGLFTLAGIPFVGPGCTASAISMDKGYTKLVLRNFGIPQARAEIARRSEITRDSDAVIARVEAQFAYPVFVKPANAGSSVGVSKARGAEELRAALEVAAREDGRVLIEEFIPGREVEVAVLGNEELAVSECGEIDPGSDFYDYETKYQNDTASYYIPARCTEKTRAALRDYAARIYHALGCRGLSRIDFFVCGEGEDERIVFNELNTLPGFTSISMYPKLFEASGIAYDALIDRLIALALEA